MCVLEDKILSADEMRPSPPSWQLNLILSERISIFNSVAQLGEI